MNSPHPLPRRSRRGPTTPIMMISIPVKEDSWTIDSMACSKKLAIVCFLVILCICSIRENKGEGKEFYNITSSGSIVFPACLDDIQHAQSLHSDRPTRLGGHRQ